MSRSQLKSLVYLFSGRYPRSAESKKELYDEASRALAARIKTWKARTWTRLGILASSGATVAGTLLATALALLVQSWGTKAASAVSSGAWSSTFGRLPLAVRWPVGIPWWAAEGSASKINYAAFLGIVGLGGIFGLGVLADAVSRAWDVDPTTARRIVQYARQIARSRRPGATIAGDDGDAAEYRRLRALCEAAGAATAEDEGFLRRLFRRGPGGSRGAQREAEEPQGTAASLGSSPAALKARAKRCSALAECLWLPPPKPRCAVHPRLKLALKRASDKISED